jgi:nucleotide-binding universal stress UspA family protein
VIRLEKFSLKNERELAWIGSLMLSIQKILVPLVFTETSQHVVRQAAWLARRFHSEMILLHVITPFGYPRGLLEIGDEMTARDLHARIVQRAQQDLDEAVLPELDGIPVTRVLLRGDPAQEIVKTARDRNVDLMMMSTLGEGVFLQVSAGLGDRQGAARKPLPGVDRGSSGGGAGARIFDSQRSLLGGFEEPAQ